tara:strand:+ start:1278 stop:1997 length:720 start_codon:yes stop_codon:yes gene_type:complete
MFTLIIPYYNQPEMLRLQLEETLKYPDWVKVIVVDDGSKLPASDYIEGYTRDLALYRIDVDIPWNREQARNLGAYVADTDWIIQVDIDHILSVDAATRLHDVELSRSWWYRFPRYRVGRADETRQKDAIRPDKEFGKIHPHVDSYLIPRLMFLSSPYDERYSGCLGGGTPFTARMSRLYGEPHMLPDDVCLHVFTRDKVKDSSISTLSRDKSEYTRRRAEIGVNDAPPRILCNPWHRII